MKKNLSLDLSKEKVTSNIDLNYEISYSIRGVKRLLVNTNIANIRFFNSSSKHLIVKVIGKTNGNLRIIKINKKMAISLYSYFNTDQVCLEIYIPIKNSLDTVSSIANTPIELHDVCFTGNILIHK